jgi:hypothetical protein
MPTKRPRKPAEVSTKVEAVPAAPAKKKRVASTAHRPSRSKKVTEPTISVPVPEVSREDISRIAYQLWIEGGCRHGNDLDDWARAERIAAAGV